MSDVKNVRFDTLPDGLTVQAADRLVRAALGAMVTGVSTGKGKLVVHLLPNASEADEAKARQVVGAYGVMQVTASKLTILADDTDTATLTCADARLNSDTKVDYRVYVDNTLYAEDVADVTGGSVSLEFGAAAPGLYTIEIARRKGNYATGIIQIEAVE